MNDTIRSILGHGTDGPVTGFVLISRAVDLSDRRIYPPEAVAEVLYLELVDRGFLSPSGEDCGL